MRYPIALLITAPITGFAVVLYIRHPPSADLKADLINLKYERDELIKASSVSKE